MISLMMYIGQWMWSCLEGIAEWVEMWMFTRRWEVARGSIPACLVAGITVFIVVGQRMKPAVAVAEPYRQGLHEAIGTKNYLQADLCFRKLIVLQVANDAIRYDFAQFALAAGKANTAWEQMRALAPEGGVGYPEAHFWLAQEALRRQAQWTVADKVNCEQHLRVAKTAPQLQSRASELLGIFALLQKNYTAAIEELKSVSEPNVGTRTLLAMAYELAGLADESQRVWSQVAAACEQELRTVPTHVESRLTLAVAFAHLEENERAVRTLREGIEASSSAANKRLTDALGFALVQRLKVTTKIPKDATQRDLLFSKLLGKSSESFAVASELIRWDDQEVHEARRMFDELYPRTQEDAKHSTTRSVPTSQK